MTCEISDVTMLTTCINVICSNEIISIILISLGLTPAYDGIYICYMSNSVGDILYTVSIVNGWLFDANFKKAFRFGRKSVDKCCKYKSEYMEYKKYRCIFHQKKTIIQQK